MLNIKENPVKVQLLSGLVISPFSVKLSSLKGENEESTVADHTNSVSRLSGKQDPLESCFNNGLDRLNDLTVVKSYRDTLKNESGIYSIVNKVNGNQCIGSAKNLYIRLLEHITGKKLNNALQAAIEKYNLSNFTFYVLEYVSYENKLVSNKEITDLETKYIAKFDFKNLYNFKRISTTMLGYEHTNQALLKWLKDSKLKKTTLYTVKAIQLRQKT